MKRVVVIEDDRGINELVSYNLSKSGFAVTSLFDGAQAQKQLVKECFDVAVLDIMLPGADGFTLCKQLKNETKGHATFVIMLTAKAAAEDKMYAHLLGADCYLTKPFKVSELIDMVKEFSSLRDKDFSVTHH